MYTFDQRIREKGPAKFRPSTSLRTGLELSAKDAFFRTWTPGKFHAMSDLRDRNHDLMALADQGFFPEEVLNKAIPERNLGLTFDDGMEDEANYGYLAEYANDHGHSFLTEEQIEEQVKAETKDRYDRKAEAYELAPPGVQAAMTTADIVGAMTDPVYAPTYMIGLPMAARSFQGMRNVMLARAGGVATFEAGIESVAQVHQYNWNNSIGINYSVEQALLSIGMAAGISGILTLGADAAAIKLRQFIDKAKNAGAKAEEVAQAEHLVGYLEGQGDVSAVDALSAAQQVGSRGSRHFTNGPTIPDEFALKAFEGGEKGATYSGKRFDNDASTWQIRLGARKPVVEQVQETVEETAVPEELLDQVIPMSTVDGTVERSVREMVEESDAITSGVDGLMDCLRKAS